MLSCLSIFFKNKRSVYVEELVNEVKNKPVNKKMCPRSIALNPQRNMDALKLPEEHLNGFYAYLIVTDAHKSQYLLLKSLENYQSNHSVLETFMRLGKFSSLTTDSDVLCGGEIIFINNKLINWNLKSGGYSLDGPYDEIKTGKKQFDENRKGLWLPENNYLAISKSENSSFDTMFYTPRGSVKNDFKMFVSKSAPELSSMVTSLSKTSSSVESSLADMTGLTF